MPMIRGIRKQSRGHASCESLDRLDNLLQRGGVPSVCATPTLRECEAQARMSPSGQMFFLQVAMYDKLRDVLAECGLRYAQPLLQLTELDIRRGMRDRTDPKPMRCMDQRIKSRLRHDQTGSSQFGV